jgi:hypothetical protein
MDILEQMVEHFGKLKELRFANFGMDPGRVSCLARLTKLEWLSWVITCKEQVRGEENPRTALDNVFPAFHSKPKIRVIENDSHFRYSQGRIKWSDYEL